MRKTIQNNLNLINFITFANEDAKQTTEQVVNKVDEQVVVQSSLSLARTTALHQNSQPQLMYLLKPAQIRHIDIGYDFDGVLHFNVTPLTCYNDIKCSRHPVDKNKDIHHTFKDISHIELNRSLIKRIFETQNDTNTYIISSNPNITHNINLLLNSYDNNPFVGIEYAPEDKLEVISKLKLKQYWDDSNYHLYRILNAESKPKLKDLIKVFPETIYSIYDTRPDNLPDRTPITNNPHTVTLSRFENDLIKVFTYNINYNLQMDTNIKALKNIAHVLNTAVTKYYDFICLQESLYGIQKLFNNASIYTQLDYTEVALDTELTKLGLEVKIKEHQYTYYKHMFYGVEAKLFGNLDVLDNDINSGTFNRPFTLLCLQHKTVKANKIILINAHFPHTNTRTNEQIASYIDMFIEKADLTVKETIKRYLANGARVIMAGDFNRVIRGTTKPKPYDNSHYGLALFKGLDDYKRPTILYNIMPNEAEFEKPTCPGNGQGHIDAVLDSWGLQYKHEYPEVTIPASDHIPVGVSLLKGRRLE